MPVRSAPTVLLDAAHNPHGATALATALTEEFDFRRLIAVIGVMTDKDAQGILATLVALGFTALIADALAAALIARFADWSAAGARRL